jgi:hypothetical protein
MNARVIMVNGEAISPSEASGLIRMLYNDAKQIAGEYHGMNRSEKFRINWPNEDLFAESEWKNFVVAARAMYAERLGDRKTPTEEARRMHLALVLEHMVAQGQRADGIEADNRLQLSPGTQQFEGDKAENIKIMNLFGKAPNLRARLRAGVTQLARLH